MDINKPTKTLADYMVIAISPALIMVMVHSVCFFLVDVFYRGEAIGGVRWVLFWFVLAVVLIARIGIEQGDTPAMIYGLLLAGAVWVYLSFVHLNPALGAILLATVWFTAHKITCNCTLVDDDADASGQGLLQSFRKLPQWFKKEATGTSPAPEEKKAKLSKPQIPGVWLLYFGLAALPIFGLSQSLLPAGDLAARHRGFIYLFFYLAAVLGLLITTSFLGLRRYLRQRYLGMPGNIAFGWIKYGVIGAAIVLCLAMFLPRPGAGQAWNALRYHVDYQLQRASQYAARFNPHGTGSGQPGNQPQTQNNPAQSGQSPGPSQNQNTHANEHGTQQSGAPSPQGTPTENQSGGGQSDKGSPNLPPITGALYPVFKFLFYLAAVICVGWLLYRYRVVLTAAVRSIWAAIRNFIAALFRLKPAEEKPSAVKKARGTQPFSAFKNPFLTGADRIWPPEELIIYSYDALLSWALENETVQGSPQTPRELCRQLGGEIPEAADALKHLAFLYGHVAYGASVPSNIDKQHLRFIWDYMARPRAKRAEPAPQNNLAVSAT